MDEPLLLDDDEEPPPPRNHSFDAAAVQIDIFPQLAAGLCCRYAGYIDPPPPPPTQPGEYENPRSSENAASRGDIMIGILGSEPRRKLGKKCRTAPALMSMHRMMRPDVAPGSGGDHCCLPSIVFQATIGLVIYLLAGIFIYLWKREEFSGNSTFALIDALYFCIVTMCTIGYGDITPITPSAKMFSCLFVLIGFGFIDFLLSAMVAYALDRQEMLLISTVDTRAKSYLVNSEKGRMRTRTKVALAFGVVLTSVGAGTLVMHHQEDLGWLDSFYLACMSVTTVGYGDHAFRSSHGRLFAAIWLLVSTIAVARAFLFLAEAHIDRRHRLIAKWVLQRKLTVGDLVAADLNNDGFISKSEYVIYKLKEMGKIKDKDVLAICNQFNELQCGNFGKITLSRLLEEANSS